ncbi:MAG: ATP-binding cassette domain-containing protein, partial [Rhizobiales bacterium]|nr:ATP-binding cassette domain-containing protein [Hyphomicrobiales bacterium]
MTVEPVPSPMIALADVHLTLTSAAGPVKILRGVDLSIDAGQSVSVVGPSGSGKSTLLSVVGGIERLSSGKVSVAGQDLDALDEDRLAVFRGETIGIIFQSFHLIPTMTALENVAVPLELAGAAEAFERAADGLQAVGLADRAS